MKELLPEIVNLLKINNITKYNQFIEGFSPSLYKTFHSDRAIKLGFTKRKDTEIIFRGCGDNYMYMRLIGVSYVVRSKNVELNCITADYKRKKIILKNEIIGYFNETIERFNEVKEEGVLPVYDIEIEKRADLYNIYGYTAKITDIRIKGFIKRDYLFSGTIDVVVGNTEKEETVHTSDILKYIDGILVNEKEITELPKLKEVRKREVKRTIEQIKKLREILKNTRQDFIINVFDFKNIYRTKKTKRKRKIIKPKKKIIRVNHCKSCKYYTPINPYLKSLLI